MRIYFSGGGGLTDTPEVLIPKERPHIMLTFHNINQKQSATIDRLKAYLKRKRAQKKTK